MDSEKKSIFSFYLIKREDHSKLRQVAEEIEKLFVNQTKGIADVLEIILTEICNHIVIQSLRRLYFKAKGLALNDMEDYKDALRKFQLNFGYLNLLYYERAMKMLEMKVNVNLDLSDKKSLTICIDGASLMSSVEEQYLRKTLNRAMQNKKNGLADLYDAYGDEMVESDMGLGMVVLLLCQMDLDPALFRIYNEKENTVARLELPLDKDYKFERDAYEKSES